MTRLEHATVGVCGRVRAVLSTGETLLLGPAGAALEISGPATTAATTATTTRLLAPLVPPSARLAPAVAAALRLRNACCPHLPPATAPCLAAPVPAEGYENDDGAVPEDTDGAAPVGPPAGPRRLGFPVTRVTWPTTVALAAAGLRPGDAAVGDVEEAVVPCELAPAAAAKRAAVRHAAFSRLLSLGLACPLPGGGWRVTTACGRCWAAVGPGLLDAWAEYPLFVDAPAPAPPPPPPRRKRVPRHRSRMRASSLPARAPASSSRSGSGFRLLALRIGVGRAWLVLSCSRYSRPTTRLQPTATATAVATERSRPWRPRLARRERGSAAQRRPGRGGRHGRPRCRRRHGR